MQEQLDASRQFLYLGDAHLSAGAHDVSLLMDGQSLAPGSGGRSEPIGPLVLSPASNENPPVRTLAASRASALCGQYLDWVEAIPTRP